MNDIHTMPDDGAHEMSKAKKYIISGTTYIDWTREIEAFDDAEAEEEAQSMKLWSWESIEDCSQVSDCVFSDVSAERKKRKSK